MSKKHARFSPSKLEALEKCVCFDYQDFTDIDDNGETPAERGTRLHKIMETGDLSLCKTDAEHDECNTCLLVIEGMVKENKVPPKRLNELHVSVGDLTYGTLDLALIFEDRAVVIDYKFVRSIAAVSDPSENLQCQTYAAGLFEAYPQVQSCAVGIFAPSIAWFPPRHVYTRNDVETLIKPRIRKVIERAGDPFKVPTPCDMCSNCANASRCPALTKDAVVVANGIGLPMPSEFAPDKLVTANDRAKGHIIARALANWADQVLSNNNEYAKQGGELPGHTKVSKPGNLVIKNPQAAWEVLHDQGILTESQLKECMSLKVAPLTEKLAEVREVEKKDARGMLEEILGEYCVRGKDIVYFMRKKSAGSDREILQLTEGT